MTDDGDPVDQLIAAAIDGDSDSLAAAFDHYRPRLHALVRLRLDRRLQGRIDAVDVVQETFLNLPRKFDGWKRGSDLPFYLWLRLEVGQKLIDIHRFHLGAMARDASRDVPLHGGGVPFVESVTLAERLLGKLSTASQAAMRLELQEAVHDALISMNERDREMLVLRHFEELSNAEAAIVLGLSPTAASNRYIRAIRRLRKAFALMPGGIEGIW